MKPTPQKPRIIIAHVEGSGTAEVTAVDSSNATAPPVGSKLITSPPKLKVPKPPHPFPQLILVVKSVVKRAGETGVALIVVPMPKWIPAANPAEFTISFRPLPPVSASPPAPSVRDWVNPLIVMRVGRNAVTPLPVSLRDWPPLLVVKVPFEVSKVNTTLKLSPVRSPPPNKFSPSVAPDDELTLETVPVYVRLTMSADAGEVRPANAATAAIHFKAGKFIADSFKFELGRHDEINGLRLAAREMLIPLVQSKWDAGPTMVLGPCLPPVTCLRKADGHADNQNA